MAKVKQPRVPSVRMVAGHKVQVDRKTTGSVRAVGSKPAAQLNGLRPHNDQAMVVGSVLRKMEEHHVRTMAVVHRRAAAVQAQAAVVRSSATVRAVAARRVVVVQAVAAAHHVAVVVQAAAAAHHVAAAQAVAVFNNGPLVGHNVPAVVHSGPAVPGAIGAQVAVVRKMGKTGTVHSVIAVGKQARSATPHHKRYVPRYVRAAPLSCRR